MTCEEDGVQSFSPTLVNYRLAVTEDGYGALLKLADGDMRKALNILQANIFTMIILLSYLSLFSSLLCLAGIYIIFYSAYILPVFDLQSTSMAFSTVDAASVYTCTGQPQDSDIEAIMGWMLNESFQKCLQGQ